MKNILNVMPQRLARDAIAIPQNDIVTALIWAVKLPQAFGRLGKISVSSRAEFYPITDERNK